MKTMRHKNTVTSLALLKDGSTLLSGSWDKKINLWDINTGDLIETLSEKSIVLSLVVLKSGLIGKETLNKDSSEFYRFF